MGLFKRMLGRADEAPAIEVGRAGQDGVVAQPAPVPGQPFDPTAPPPGSEPSALEDRLTAAGLDAEVAQLAADKVEDKLQALGMDLSGSGTSWTIQAGDGKPVVFQPGTGPAQVAPGAASADPLDQLARLGELRDRKVLTEAEFQAQKAKLLGESGSPGA